MSWPSLRKVTNAVRVGLVVLAAGVAVLTVLYLGSMPPPPPDSDGFAHGMAAIIGGGITLTALGLANLVVITPTLLGREDHLGFHGRQRVGLKAAGGLIGLGVFTALVAGLDGAVLLLACLVLAFGIVCAMLLWRLGEVVAERRAGRGVAE